MCWTAIRPVGRQLQRTRERGRVGEDRSRATRTAPRHRPSRCQRSSPTPGNCSKKTPALNARSRSRNANSTTRNAGRASTRWTGTTCCKPRPSGFRRPPCCRNPSRQQSETEQWVKQWRTAADELLAKARNIAPMATSSYPPNRKTSTTCGSTGSSTSTWSSETSRPKAAMSSPSTPCVKKARSTSCGMPISTTRPKVRRAISTRRRT